MNREEWWLRGEAGGTRYDLRMYLVHREGRWIVFEDGEGRRIEVMPRNSVSILGRWEQNGFFTPCTFDIDSVYSGLAEFHEKTREILVTGL